MVELFYCINFTDPWQFSVMARRQPLGKALGRKDFWVFFAEEGVVERSAAIIVKVINMLVELYGHAENLLEM